MYLFGLFNNLEDILVDLIALFVCLNIVDNENPKYFVRNLQAYQLIIECSLETYYIYKCFERHSMTIKTTSRLCIQ